VDAEAPQEDEHEEQEALVVLGQGDGGGDPSDSDDSDYVPLDDEDDFAGLPSDEEDACSTDPEEEDHYQARRKGRMPGWVHGDPSGGDSDGSGDDPSSRGGGGDGDEDGDEDHEEDSGGAHEAGHNSRGGHGVARAIDDGRPPPGLKVELPQFKVKQARAWLEQLESVFDASRADDAWRVVLSMQRMDMESAKATRSRLQREGLGNPTWVQVQGGDPSPL